MKKIILHCIHIDEGNWKNRFEACFQNPTDYTAEQAEPMIRKCLIDGEFFSPEKVGLPFSFAADRHEFDWVEAEYEGQQPLATSSRDFFGMTLQTLIDNLKESNKAHLQPIKVQKIPAGISIRLAVSWLEFLNEMRQTLDDIAALFHKNDLNTIEKTL
jgi:hypothetical protein